MERLTYSDMTKLFRQIDKLPSSSVHQFCQHHDPQIRFYAAKRVMDILTLIKLKYSHECQVGRSSIADAVEEFLDARSHKVFSGLIELLETDLKGKTRDLVYREIDYFINYRRYGNKDDDYWYLSLLVKLLRHDNITNVTFAARRLLLSAENLPPSGIEAKEMAVRVLIDLLKHDNITNITFAARLLLSAENLPPSGIEAKEMAVRVLIDLLKHDNITNVTFAARLLLSAENLPPSGIEAEKMAMQVLIDLLSQGNRSESKFTIHQDTLTFLSREGIKNQSRISVLLLALEDRTEFALNSFMKEEIMKIIENLIKTNESVYVGFENAQKDPNFYVRSYAARALKRANLK